MDDLKETRAAAAQTATALALEGFLPYRLNHLADAVSREFQKIYKQRHGLTRPEWRTLATLGQFGTMTATAIGEHSSMHKTKVSRAVAELERRKWLQRTSDPNDRRVERLVLTRAGDKVYRELVPVAKGFEAAVFNKMNEAEKAAVVTGLAALERAFARK
ncbi:MarR family transcriptional regulator [Mesorhizobium sp. L-8-10]|uniref:MarR family winged helix-turn-helix transcriptional regulator n=1 Tax=Mesorhizobium sp. L-8-10 TaxID=2744523 RepID=UPI0019282A55|nr:MarR family transcriptional regulator [Mesorhizobium sp. L-8-10]BCH34420.1 MarR family transcriptional regulator [Mesorhizobium sp. L-8-10]